MSYDAYRNVAVTVTDGLAEVSLNRPDQLNGVNAELHQELEDLWPELAQDEAIRVILLTGAGKAFSAGGDIANMAARAGTEESMRQALSLPRRGRRLMQGLLDISQPVIAAVNGDAIGLGATLALFCDIVVMAEEARLGDPHVRVGLVAGDGGALIWPLLMGPNRAKDMLMRGRLVTGSEAERMNLVGYAVPAGEVMPKAREIATDLLRLPPWAVRFTKASVNQRLKQGLNEVLDLSLAYEALSFQTRDHGEAARAFLEKRRPDFRGI